MEIGRLNKNTPNILSPDRRASLHESACMSQPAWAYFMLIPFVYLPGHFPWHIRLSWYVQNSANYFSDLPGYLSPSVFTGDGLRHDLLITHIIKRIYLRSNFLSDLKLISSLMLSVNWQLINERTIIIKKTKVNIFISHHTLFSIIFYCQYSSNIIIISRNITF